MGGGCKKRNEEQPIESVPLTIKIEEPTQDVPQTDDIFSVRVESTPPKNNQEPQAYVKYRIGLFCFVLYFFYT